ncbi:MAG: restriction endonuclease subunit M/S [Ignavibacteria bacterium]|nr:restriction endonuclease subunit M/S [Ignavibacteria bacterium]
MLTSEIKQKIDNARNILVGIIPTPTGQVEQITLALIYKFMSDIDAQNVSIGGKPKFFIGEYEKYDWKNLIDLKLSGLERVMLYGEGLEKMNLNPNLPGFFRDIFKGAFLPFRNPEVLLLFLSQINEFSYSHSEELGNAFEYLLSVLGSQGEAGQFRTPRHIIDFIVEIISPQKTDKVLDPACGTAGFLISAYKYIMRNNTAKNSKLSGSLLTLKERQNLKNNFVGYDISHDMVRLSRVNMFLHEFPEPKIHEYDTLTSLEKWDDDYDCILANPPFMTPKGGIRPHKRFSIQANRSEVLFVDYICEHLNPTGKAGIIVPEGIIFQSANAYKSLRKMLVDGGYLFAVVSLPSGVFNPYAGVKTSVLLIDRTIAKHSDNILFVKVENDGYDLGAQRREIEKNDLPVAVKILLEYKSGYKDFQIKKYEPMAVLVPKSKLSESGEYNLSGERYKETNKIVSKWEMVELGELCKIERGSSITKKNIKAGDIPVIAGGQTAAYYHNEANRCGEVITVSSSGAYAGFINYFKNPIFASDCSTIQPKDLNKLNCQYLYFILKSKQDDFYKLQQGGAQPHVYPRDYKNFLIPLPPLEVQKEIVAELDGYQKIINSAKQIVENYKPQIKIDPKWKMERLGSVLKTSSGGTPLRNKKEYFENGNIHWVKSGEVSAGYIYNTEEKITELGLKESSAKLFPPNTVLIALYGATVGQVGILKIYASTNQAVCGIFPNSIIIPEFLYHILKQETKTFINFSVGGAQPNISQKIVQDFLLPLPPLEVQKEIVARLDDEQKLIDANKKLISIYEQKIKDEINKVWESDQK